MLLGWFLGCFLRRLPRVIPGQCAYIGRLLSVCFWGWGWMIWSFFCWLFDAIVFFFFFGGMRMETSFFPPVVVVEGFREGFQKMLQRNWNSTGDLGQGVWTCHTARRTTVWMVLKPVVNNGKNYQPQVVQDFFPSTVLFYSDKSEHLWIWRSSSYFYDSTQEHHIIPLKAPLFHCNGMIFLTIFLCYFLQQLRPWEFLQDARMCDVIFWMSKKTFWLPLFEKLGYPNLLDGFDKYHCTVVKGLMAIATPKFGGD